MAVIEAKAARQGAPILAFGQHWHVTDEAGRLVFQDENGLLDLPLPNLPGPFQIQNAGAAIAALRALGKGAAACEAAVTKAVWPARMQRLKAGPVTALAGGLLASCSSVSWLSAIQPARVLSSRRAAFCRLRALAVSTAAATLAKIAKATSTSSKVKPRCAFIGWPPARRGAG